MLESTPVIDLQPQPNIRKFLLQLLIDVVLFVPTFISALVFPFLVTHYAALYFEPQNVSWFSPIGVICVGVIWVGVIWVGGFFGILLTGVRLSSLLKSRFDVQYFWEVPDSSTNLQLPSDGPLR